MAGAIYLLDTSVFVLQGRHEVARRRYEQLLLEGRLAVCQLTMLECLNNAPDLAGYTQLWRALAGHRWLDTTAPALEHAVETHRALAVRSQHRNFSLADLIIAGTAQVHGVTVLHYDADYDRIAAITGQPVEWVAPRGSLQPPATGPGA